tara:strand:- start:108 stop:614 length:507 start_codon:yes stop_codon:yes gene_type:complete
MSKKSRRRNKKILGALALIGGLGLAARNKRNKAIDTGIKSAEDDKGSNMLDTEFKEQVVVIPEKKPVINNNVFRTRNRITDSAGNTIPSSKKQIYIAKNKAPKNVMGPFDYMQTKPRVKSDLEQYMDNNPLSISAKKGGRIVKGKKTAVRTGAAKRGFGRAYLKGGKK